MTIDQLIAALQAYRATNGNKTISITSETRFDNLAEQWGPVISTLFREVVRSTSCSGPRRTSRRRCRWQSRGDLDEVLIQPRRGSRRRHCMIETQHLGPKARRNIELAEKLVARLAAANAEDLRLAARAMRVWSK